MAGAIENIIIQQNLLKEARFNLDAIAYNLTLKID